MLEAGAGIGNLTNLLLQREYLLAADYEPTYLELLRSRFAYWSNVRVERVDLTQPPDLERWRNERLDTVLCSNVLEHLQPDEQVLRSFHETLAPGGHCIIVVPAGRWLYTDIDKELGHYRRYTREDLRAKMVAAGFDVVFERQFGRLGALSWALSGHVFRRRHLSPLQMKAFDRLLPVARTLEYLLPLPGMSLIMVGQKSSLARQRLAA
jgi:SAM-dependent methyltransferase